MMQVEFQNQRVSTYLELMLNVYFHVINVRNIHVTYISVKVDTYMSYVCVVTSHDDASHIDFCPPHCAVNFAHFHLFLEHSLTNFMTKKYS
jgi:hypothetical protein